MEIKPRRTRRINFAANGLFFLCACALLALPARAQTEVAPADPSRSYLVSPRSFGDGFSRGGTYYLPQVVATTDTLWLFVMGGQFDGGPAAPCSGDKILVFKLPNTQAGVTTPVNSDTVKQRVSPCDNASGDTTKLYHYSTGGVAFDNVFKTYRMIAERWEARSNTITMRLFEGWYRSTGVGWNVKWYDFMDVVPGMGPARLNPVLLAPDPARPASAGHSYFRGYARMGQYQLAEMRVDFTDQTCAEAATRRCANIEFRKDGAWRQVAGQRLDFMPDSIADFRASSLISKGGRLQLWGSVLSPSNECGMCPNATAPQQSSSFAYYDADPVTFALGARHDITSAVRCMPSWHKIMRAFVYPVTVGGQTYLLNSNNDDDLCATLDHPYSGMDVVWTRIQ
jgi:hypothetical protein